MLWLKHLLTLALPGFLVKRLREKAWNSWQLCDWKPPRLTQSYAVHSNGLARNQTADSRAIRGQYVVRLAGQLQTCYEECFISNLGLSALQINSISWKTQSEKICLRLKTQPDVCFKRFVIIVESIQSISLSNLLLMLGLHVSLATNLKKRKLFWQT